jgi:hypothetical protein
MASVAPGLAPAVADEQGGFAVDDAMADRQYGVPQ